jgi:hypothetical protein
VSPTLATLQFQPVKTPKTSTHANANQITFRITESRKNVSHLMIIVKAVLAKTLELVTNSNSGIIVIVTKGSLVKHVKQTSRNARVNHVETKASVSKEWAGGSVTVCQGILEIDVRFC